MCSKSYFNKTGLRFGLLLLVSGIVSAQEQAAPDTLKHILVRLDVLERQNQALLSEVQALREELKASRPQATSQNQVPQDQASQNQAPQNQVPQNEVPQNQVPQNQVPQNQALEERIQVAEQRIKEQAQTKVEASQRFPISLTGMLLFDAFLNSGQHGYGGSYGYNPPDTAPAGATLSQSIVGLEFRGPSLPGGGQVHGSLSMDFYSQSGDYDAFRLRRGILSFDWKRRSITVGQDKSIIAPLQPTSFARVGIPPLDGAGNLWLWRPQIRYEERIPLTTNTQATLQAGVLQTEETYSTPSLPANAELQPSRPAIQGRFGLAHQWSEQSRISAGIGFHASSTHLLGQSVNSRVISGDFLFKPLSKIEFSGTVFHGENFSNIGGGPPGVSVTRQGLVIPIHGTGGWIQVALPVTKRLTLDFYSGRQLNDANDLHSYEVARTLTYAGNILYRISPNVVLGFEASQSRVDYIDLRKMVTNRYDATAAYLF